MRLALPLLAFIVVVAFASQVYADDYDYETCDTWAYALTKGYKYYGGSSVGVRASASPGKCGDLCIEDDNCYSFNYYKRKCYMYKEKDDDLNYKSAVGYYKGYTYCDDKK
jgi:PAN domain